MKFRFNISPDGSLKAVYNDVLATMQLGPMEVKRESNVEFNVVKQLWEAIDASGHVMTTSPMRDECLRQEKEIVENQLLGSL